MEMTDRLSWAWIQATSCCDGKFEMIWQQRHRNDVSLLFYYCPNFHLISWDKLYTLSITRSVKFAGYIWEACNGQINFMNSDEIIPWGFQETAGKFSVKRKLFDFSWGFCQIWRHTLQHYSSAFLCHTDFIPGRSCLDVPVGRKCSACNGSRILPWTTVSLWSVSPSLPLNCSETPRTGRNRPCGAIDIQEYHSGIHCFWWFAHVIL